MNPLAQEPCDVTAGGFGGARKTTAIFRLARWRSLEQRGALKSSED
jgi:hypothetical protein